MSGDEEVMLTGQCLCGDVRFEVKGEISSFHLCYCGRCRHVTGSAHAANLFAKPESLRWLNGESLIKRFELEGAKAFANQFCCQCGSRLPYINRAGSFLVIPAGSINDDVPYTPNDRIFTSSQANWVACISELLNLNAIQINFSRLKGCVCKSTRRVFASRLVFPRNL